MRPRFFRKLATYTAVACVATALLMAPVASAQTGAAKPVAVVAIQDYDNLIADIDFLGTLGGQKNAGQQLEGMIALFTQGQGLQGLNKSQPWGAVVQTDGFQFAPIVCLPVDDLDPMMALIQNFGMVVSDAGDGMKEIEAPNQSVYVKSAGKWAFASTEVAMLDNVPADPAKLFDGLTGDYDVAVKLMVQNVPEMYRDIAVTQMRAGMEQGLIQNPGETDEAFELRKQFAESQVDQIVQVINESDEFTIGWNVDASEGNTYFDFIYTMVPGSELARINNAIGESQSRFTGFTKGDPSMSMALAQQSPAEAIEKQRDQFAQMFDQFRAQIANEIEQDGGVPDEVRQGLIEITGDLLDAAEATLLTGTLDMAMSANLSPESLTVVAGMHAEETAKIEASLKKVGALAENEPDAPTFAFDIETFEGVRMHQVSIDVPDHEDEARQMFGDTLVITVGASDDSLYVSLGRDSAATLKQAISDSKAAGPANVKPFEMVMSVESIMSFAAAMEDGPQQPMLEKIAQRLSEDADGATHVRITGEQIENGVRYRFEAESGVLEAIGEAGKAARQAGAGARF